MKIYTKTGDEGMSSLFGGSRVSKTDVRLEACGTLDELNAYLGMLRSVKVNEDQEWLLLEAQEAIFSMGSWLSADPDKPKLKKPPLKEEWLENLEEGIDILEEDLPALQNFIIPGGLLIVSLGHIARAVCRRAERMVVRVSEIQEIHPLIMPYLNRLSDYLFVLVRSMSYTLGSEETPWLPFEDEK